MKCVFCGNDEAAFFYKGSKGWYCRKCVKFKNTTIKESNLKVVDSEYQLAFNLTPRQQHISDCLVKLVKQKQSVLLEAVCGAGKTELVYQVIAENLKEGRKVGFAIARRQVVLEIAERLASVFTKLKVIAVCQGYTSIVDGDLIVCTTHQLYRYYQYFDLLILDEPDAFPFKGNALLAGFAKSCCKGQTIYLTATPDASLKEKVSKGELAYLYLSKRPSGKPLCVPQVIYAPKAFLIVYAIYKAYLSVKKQKLMILFVPTIKMARSLYKLLKPYLNCCSIDSLSVNKDEIIADFKKEKYRVCISTTVLERGITIPKVDVLVLHADSAQFDEASLTQMAGRVGRSLKYPIGECLFLSSSKSLNIDNCLNSLRKANSDG